jgi:DNA repair exonuclease SbcCD nuclease subunit
MFVSERIDYVALGHIHKYQVLRQENPPSSMPVL